MGKRAVPALMVAGISAELRADTIEEFDRVLSRTRRIDGVSNTETSLLLSAHKL